MSSSVLFINFKIYFSVSRSRLNFFLDFRDSRYEIPVTSRCNVFDEVLCLLMMTNFTLINIFSFNVHFTVQVRSEFDLRVTKVASPEFSFCDGSVRSKRPQCCLLDFLLVEYL